MLDIILYSFKFLLKYEITSNNEKQRNIRFSWAIMKMNGPNDYHAYGDENGYSTSYNEKKLLSFFKKTRQIKVQLSKKLTNGTTNGAQEKK